MIKTLVTGASGFIGRHSLPLLLKAGHEVHAVSLKKKNPIISGVNWHQADLKSYSQTKKLFADIRPTHLLHFAWTTEPGSFWDDLENKKWHCYDLIEFNNYKTALTTCANKIDIVISQ